MKKKKAILVISSILLVLTAFVSWNVYAVKVQAKEQESKIEVLTNKIKKEKFHKDKIESETKDLKKTKEDTEKKHETVKTQVEKKQAETKKLEDELKKLKEQKGE